MAKCATSKWSAILPTNMTRPPCIVFGLWRLCGDCLLVAVPPHNMYRSFLTWLLLSCSWPWPCRVPRAGVRRETSLSECQEIGFRFRSVQSQSSSRNNFRVHHCTRLCSCNSEYPEVNG